MVKRTFQDERNKFIRKVIFINLYEPCSRAAKQMNEQLKEYQAEAEHFC